MRPRSLMIVALAAGTCGCAETPLLGPGPDMDAPRQDAVALGGIPPGRSEVTAGLEDRSATAVGSGEIEDLEDDEGLPDPDDTLEDEGVGLAEDDEGLLGDDEGLLGRDQSPLEDDEGPLDDGEDPLEDGNGLTE